MARQLKVYTTHKDLRNRRTREVRAKTESMLRLSRRELERGRLLFPRSEDGPRPRVRGDCIAGPRPCPYVACRYHLYLDVKKNGAAIKYNFPDLEVGELSDSCALDVADNGGNTLEVVAKLMNLVREAESRAKRVVADHLLDKVRARKREADSRVCARARGGEGGRP